MKKHLHFLVILCLGVIMATSCGKSSVTPTSNLSSTPDANAAENSKSGGVYKGVVVGSSGTFKITLQGGKIEISLTFDGVTKTLTTTSLASWSSGQAINNVTFSSGDWSMKFSVGADGSNPSVLVTVPGHTCSATIVKETSTTVVKAYEGTYAGDDSGIWNFIITGSTVYGVAKSTLSGNSVGNVYFAGSVSGNTITVVGSSSSPDAVGTINGDQVSGTWGNSSFKGTWKGARTL